MTKQRSTGDSYCKFTLSAARSLSDAFPSLNLGMGLTPTKYLHLLSLCVAMRENLARNQRQRNSATVNDDRLLELDRALSTHISTRRKGSRSFCPSPIDVDWNSSYHNCTRLPANDEFTQLLVLLTTVFY